MPMDFWFGEKFGLMEKPDLKKKKWPSIENVDWWER